MLGAMIGDIVGSVYQWDRIKTKEFPFFTDTCFFTQEHALSHYFTDASDMLKIVKELYSLV